MKDLLTALTCALMPTLCGFVCWWAATIQDKNNTNTQDYARD